MMYILNETNNLIVFLKDTLQPRSYPLQKYHVPYVPCSYHQKYVVSLSYPLPFCSTSSSRRNRYICTRYHHCCCISTTHVCDIIPSFIQQRMVRIFVWHDVKVSWCRVLGGKGRRGISFAWRQHRFFFIDFSLLALSYDKLEETGRGGVGEGGEGEGGGGVRARVWREAHRVRFTPALLLCSLLDLYLWNVQGTFS